MKGAAMPAQPVPAHEPDRAEPSALCAALDSSGTVLNEYALKVRDQQAGLLKSGRANSDGVFGSDESVNAPGGAAINQPDAPRDGAAVAVGAPSPEGDEAAQVRVLLQHAHHLYSEKSYQAALTVCQHIYERAPHSTDGLLLMGAIYYHLGNYAQSVRCNDACLLLDATIAEAHANLANSLQQLGHLATATAYYQMALRLQPNFPDACNNLASIYAQLGDVVRAVEFYSAALRINPGLADVHQNLGDLLLAQGGAAVAQAQQHFQAALKTDPTYARAWRGLGDAMRESCLHDKAVPFYLEAMAHDAASLEALTGLGLSYKELGRLPDAQAAFEAALRLQPHNALALGNLAGLYFEQGKLERAVVAYQRAIQLQPNFPEAYNNLGNTLRELGRSDDAIACYTACIQLQYGHAPAPAAAGGAPPPPAAGGAPGAPPPPAAAALQAQRLAVAFSNLGGLLKMQGRLVDAITCYEHVAALQPGLPEVQANVAAAYKDAGRHDAAIAAYLRALHLRPDFPEAFANLAHSLQSVCDWRDRDALFTRLQADVRRALAAGELPCVQPFHAMSYPFPADLALAISRRYARHYALSAAALKAPPLPHPPRLRPARLRVAYLSSDFANHPLSHLMASVFGLHDRARVEVFCFALSPPDGSEWRARIEREAEHFLDVSAWPTAAVARRVAQAGVHIAVNLNGYTKGARNEVFPLRPAPVQCAYMGFPATMGADYLPYLISDPVVAPRALHHCYSEALALMPHCYFINDYKRSHSHLLAAGAQPARAEFGLPEGKVIFSCSNQLYKYDPETFATWMRILQRVPDSVLWLLRFPAYGEPRIFAEAAARGVARERIVFTDVAPKGVHIARSGLADVFLDTPLCNAHTTGCDVLWGGAPIVTLPLERMASRVCASLCMATGHGAEMVVASQAEYEERAVEWGLDAAKRGALRARLKAARLTCPLFDTARWVRNLERVFARMWAIHCAGEEPHWFQITEDDPLPGAPALPGDDAPAPPACAPRLATGQKRSLSATLEHAVAGEADVAPAPPRDPAGAAAAAAARRGVWPER